MGGVTFIKLVNVIDFVSWLLLSGYYQLVVMIVNPNLFMIT